MSKESCDRLIHMGCTGTAGRMNPISGKISRPDGLRCATLLLFIPRASPCEVDFMMQSNGGRDRFLFLEDRNGRNAASRSISSELTCGAIKASAPLSASLLSGPQGSHYPTPSPDIPSPPFSQELRGFALNKERRGQVYGHVISREGLSEVT
eukprot:753501-Hanusia_phi.AAC.2